MEKLLKYAIVTIFTKVVYDSLFSEEPEEETKSRRIFISHSWGISSENYKSLKRKLKKYNIEIYDHSIPINKALNLTKKQELENAFRKQMAYCSKIFVLADKGLKETSFVMTEIKIAKKMDKEIIAIRPYKQNGIPSFIRKNSTVVINNNINEIKRILNDGY